MVEPALPRILVVDDAEDNRFLVQVFLEGEGFLIDTADSGQDAISQLQTNPPDLVLMDMMMPEMNGLEMLSYMQNRQMLQSIPVLFVTGCSPAQLAKLAETAAVPLNSSQILTKPIDLEELLAQIRLLLQKA